MSDTNERHDPLAGLRPPRAPAGLEVIVLTAATRAFDEAPQTTWDRLWNSRSARLAWGTATVALVVAHLGLSLAPSGRPSTEQARATSDDSQQELNEVLDVPRIEISPEAAAICLGGSSKKRDKDKEVSG